MPPALDLDAATAALPRGERLTSEEVRTLTDGVLAGTFGARTNNSKMRLR